MAEEKRLMKGNEAMGEAAIRAGCTAYFGYPITPQNELTAYMARHMIDNKRIFIQAESEVSAINMVYGAAAAGARSMTSSSSPGVSLKQEGHLLRLRRGCPLRDRERSPFRPRPRAASPRPRATTSSPPAAAATATTTTSSWRPKSVQEAADLTFEAFDLADKWRMPVMVLADGMIGQMMEGVTFPEPREPVQLPKRPWAVGGQQKTHRPINHVSSINLVPAELEATIRARFKRYDEIKKRKCASRS